MNNVSFTISNRLRRWQTRLLRAHRHALKSSPKDAGIAVYMAVIATLLVIVGALMITTRSISSWLSQSGNSQYRTARDAAEYGFNEIVGQLNDPDNSYLLISQYNQWGSVSYDDISKCGIGAPSASSVSSNTLKGSASGNATLVPGSNDRLAYRLTNYEAPKLPTGYNQALGACTSSIAAKFGNLAGGSAIVTIKGEARNEQGAVTATYTLERTIHVLPPSDDAIANPILLMATGSKLYGLNGNICQGTPSTTSCVDQPLTVVSCVDLADCISNNLKEDKTLSSFCQTSKKFKRNTLCNTYQQGPLLNELPTYPGFNNTSVYGSTINNLSNAQIKEVKIQKCKVSTAAPPSCEYSVDFETKSKSDFQQTGSFYFPYNTTTPPTTSSPLLPMCVETIDNTITCRIDKLHSDSETALVVYTRTTNSSGVNKPVNLFIGKGGKDTYKDIELDYGIVNNAISDFPSDASQSWRSLRIYSRAFTSTITNACSSEDEIKIDAKNKKAFGVDGAFIWLPDAKMTFKKKDQSSSYFVAWLCELDGDKDDQSPSTLVTPLQKSDVKGGVTNLFANSWSAATGGYYRAYGATETIRN